MDTVQILIDLRAQRERIDQAIAALEALEETATTPIAAKTSIKAAKPAAVKSTKTARVVPPGTKKRVVSPESRQRMAEGQQKRWAAKKAAKAPAGKKAAAVAPTTEKPAKKAPKKDAPKNAKGGITTDGRKRISEAAKARWAAKKAAAANTA